MKNLSKYLLTLAVSFSILLPVNNVIAASSKKALSNNSEPLSEEQHHYWYDGDKKRSIWNNPHMIAELNPKPEQINQLKSRYAVSEVVAESSSTIRYWRFEDRAVNINNVVKNLQIESVTKLTASPKFSPVFHDAASTGGSKRVLPGNVIVQLNVTWDIMQVEAWFMMQGVTVIRSISMAPNSFLIKSEPGIDTLEMANRLYETGDVILSTPNWLKRAYKR